MKITELKITVAAGRTRDVYWRDVTVSLTLLQRMAYDMTGVNKVALWNLLIIFEQQKAIT